MPPYSDSSRIASTRTLSQAWFAAVTKAKKIDIACWAVWLITPNHEKHCALQDKAIPIVGLAQAVQKSF
jgi:hypothetical protein